MSELQRILVVSANADFPRAAIEERGFAVSIATDCDTAFEKLLEASVDLVAIDLAPGLDGIEFIQRVRATPQLTGTLILIISRWGTGEPTLALSAGADAYEPNETTSIDSGRLITSIERLLSRKAAAANQQIL